MKKLRRSEYLLSTFLAACLLLALGACNSIPKKENLAKAGAPQAILPTKSYVFLSGYSTRYTLLTKFLLQNEQDKTKLALTFDAEKEPTYALFELEPGNYQALGFTFGNDPFGDAMDSTTTAPMNKPLDLCAGCVIYVGRARLTKTTSVSKETYEYVLSDASAEDLKKLQELTSGSVKEKIKNTIK